MPNGFWYASGPRRMDERKAGSAFSKGDLLTLNSASSLSRLNPFAAAANTLYAVANSDSTNSIRGLCSVTVIQPTTRFWARTTPGSALTTGEQSGVSFATGLAGRYEVNASSATAIFTVVEGTDRVDQSVQSKVVGQFRFAAGELNLS